ncbi:unnamed protein product [Allacma fusca]|uniref:Uncharacterized protein n=1 Tax=Allacma fusca TaxID=39272 RepID=A0A8J2J7S0_9HEXA|nr:unnamed protein product [Allacma fusca]
MESRVNQCKCVEYIFWQNCDHPSCNNESKYRCPSQSGMSTKDHHHLQLQLLQQQQQPPYHKNGQEKSLDKT